jgi:hypothetical protein
MPPTSADANRPVYSQVDSVVSSLPPSSQPLDSGPKADSSSSAAHAAIAGALATIHGEIDRSLEGLRIGAVVDIYRWARRLALRIAERFRRT